MALDVSTFVDIRTQIAAGGVPSVDFGRGLLVTINPAIAAGGSGKAVLFNNITEATAVLGAGAALDAAAVWFSANPGPQALWVGRWATAAVATTLRSGAAPTVAANGCAVGMLPTLRILVERQRRYSGHFGCDHLRRDCHGVPSTDCAAGGIFTGATFTYFDAVAQPIHVDAGGRRMLSTLLTLELQPLALTYPPRLGFAQSDSPTYLLGHAIETITEALGEMGAIAAGSVAVMLAGDAPLVVGAVDTRTAAAAWVQAGDKIFGLRETAAQALVTNDATSHSALAFAANQGQVASVFDSVGALPDVGLLALMSAQRLNQPASIITAHAKPIPGVAASDITPTQYEELRRKRVNIVTRVGGLSRLVGGFTSRADYWLDASWWLLWIKNEMEVAVWNALGSSRRLTPGQLTDAVTAVLNVGVLNGGIQPGGTVNACYAFGRGIGNGQR